MNFFRFFSYNTILTIEMIDEYPDEDWDWKRISSHPFKKDYEKEIKKLRL